MFIRRNKIIIGCLLLATISGACSKEKVQVSEKKEYYYQIPQGNAPYDKQVVDWYNKYGTYVLYNFPKNAYEYAITNYYGTLHMQGPADPVALPVVMEYMKKYWFAFYPEEFLKKYLPRKVLLAGIMENDIGSSTGPDTLKLPVAGFDFILIPGLDNNFAKQPFEQKMLWKSGINSLFFKILFYGTTPEVKAKLPLPEAFFSVCTYDETNLDDAAMYAKGYMWSRQNGNAPSQQDDLDNYVVAMTYYSEKEMEESWLRRDIDTKGLIRKKYLLLRNYIKEKYNIDLQEIGNKQQ